jgi:hypothetical protein
MLEFLVLWTYYSTVYTSPGFLPLNWVPDDTTPEANRLLMSSDRRDISSPTWCGKCHSYRPLRSHHCRHCGRCVLVYDHHCPWVNNCIGHGNRKSFFIWLGYTTVLSLIGYILLSYRLLEIIYLKEDSKLANIWTLDGLLLLWLMFVAMSLGAWSANMFSSQMILIALNLTIPEKEKISSRFDALFRQTPEQVLDAVQQNFIYILGPSRLTWFIPSASESDPFNYPTILNDDNLKIEEGKDHRNTESKIAASQEGGGGAGKNGDDDLVLHPMMTKPLKMRNDDNDNDAEYGKDYFNGKGKVF